QSRRPRQPTNSVVTSLSLSQGAVGSGNASGNGARQEAGQAGLLPGPGCQTGQSKTSAGSQRSTTSAGQNSRIEGPAVLRRSTAAYSHSQEANRPALARPARSRTIADWSRSVPVQPLSIGSPP